MEWLAVLALGALLAGCTDNPGQEGTPRLPADSVEQPSPPASGAGPDTSASAAPRRTRPETMQGSITLEGTAEPMLFRLYRSPEGFSLPFSTYVPEDMAAEIPASDGESTVRFATAFPGQGAQPAYLDFVVLPPGLTEEEARRRVREVAAARGESRRRTGEPGAHPWALEWYGFQGADRRVGSVLLGRHGPRFFYVLSHYPAEMGDGFGPRAERILTEWRWESTGSGLARG